MEEIVLQDQSTSGKDSADPPLQRILHWVKTHQTPEPMGNGAPSTIPDIPEEEEQREDIESVLQKSNQVAGLLGAVENGQCNRSAGHSMLSNGNTWTLHNGMGAKKSKA